MTKLEHLQVIDCKLRDCIETCVIKMKNSAIHDSLLNAHILIKKAIIQELNKEINEQTK